MSVSLQRIPGVESVDISLNQGRARIVLRAGNSVTLAQVTQVVKDKGFTPREARVVARGELAEAGGKLQFGLLNTNQVFDLAFGPQAAKTSADARMNLGKPLLVEGIIPPPTGKTPSLLQLQNFRPAP